MKKLIVFINLLVALSVCAQGDVPVPPRPNPPKLVNDLAHAMTGEQIEALERKLDAYDDSTSSQIAVVTIPTTNGNDIEEVALGILRSWGVGGQKNNNGIVILAAIEDHKVWISTGYGLEGAVPDITAKAIIDNDILPNFRQNNFYRGFDLATSSIMQAAAGEYKAPEGYRSKGKGGGVGIGKFILIIIIIIVIIVSSGGGSGGGGYMSRRGSGWLGPFILGNMLGRSSGSGWGGSSGGFGGGFGGGGGGGFGGFGGGSGGGGGAGGSW